MWLRRPIVIVASITAALVLLIVLYLAFADLGAHKGRIEAFVTKQIGRPFAIDGAFRLKLLPSVSVLAEQVRLGNADWGSKPEMVQIGHASAEIRLWSLVSGPVDIRSFQLRDVSVLLEKNPRGEGNWVFGTASAPADTDSPSGGASGIPAVIQDGKFSNVQVVLREPAKPDRVALIESLTIGLGADGLLAIAGQGKIHDYTAKLAGDIGPMKALFSGRNIRMAIKGAVGNLQLDAKGAIGRLDPLDGADLALKLQNPDLGTMLKNLDLPVIATGAMNVDAQLKDAGKLTQLDLDAKLGDISASTNGTLRTLGFTGSDLRFKASVANAARLAKVFDVTDVPDTALDVGGHVTFSRKETKFDALTARLAGAQLTADGTIPATRKKNTEIHFVVTAESLKRLRESLPDRAFSASGHYVGSAEKIQLKDLKTRIGETEISGWAAMSRTGKKHLEADLSSPRIDLTPLAKKETSDAEAKETGKKAAADAAPKPEATQQKFVFQETPLPFDKLKDIDAKLHFTAGEVKRDLGVLKDVEATLTVDGSGLGLEGQARGGVDGTLNGSMNLKPTGNGAGELNLNVTVKNLHAGFLAGDAVQPGEVPPMNVEAILKASGGSARQLASSANGRILMTQGPGKTKSGVLGLFGGDIFAQLASKLNPFSAQDPYMHLECSVARIDIANGQATIKPVLIQAKKVTITGQGNVDLHTEGLKFDFNTRPREGIGVSAGMFTNPFIELSGSLTSPRIGVGAKGAASGAVAAATAGASVVAKGLVDRVKGEEDACKKTLAEATSPNQTAMSK